jgi:hypothetical protein
MKNRIYTYRISRSDPAKRNAVQRTGTTWECPKGSAEHSGTHSDHFESTSEHRVLRVPELLDEILGHTGADAQLAAWYVSKAWRASAASVWRRNPCAPVEYGECIGPAELALPWLQPEAEVLKAFEQEFCDLESRNSLRATYFPAVLTQVSSVAIQYYQDGLDHAKKDWEDLRIGRVPTSHEPASKAVWLDLSQFRLNPYLSIAFGDRMAVRRGRCEIALRPSKLHPIHGTSRLPASFLAFIGNMLVCQPPCKTLGLYHYCPRQSEVYLYDSEDSEDRSQSFLKLLLRIHDDQGIRVEQLLTALNHSCPAVLESWLEQAEELKSHIPGTHWIDDIWGLPGAPKIFIYLDNSQMKDGVNKNWHITREAYVSANGFREEREREWVPKELIEPSESTTGRSPINWYQR